MALFIQDLCDNGVSVIWRCSRQYLYIILLYCAVPSGCRRV